MTIFLNILLGLAAGITWLFVIGDDKEHPMTKEQRKCAASAFVALIVLIIALNTFM